MNKRILKYQHITPGTNVRVSDYREFEGEEASSFFEGIVLRHEKLRGGMDVLIVDCNYDSQADCASCFCNENPGCETCRVGREIIVPMEIINDYEGRIKIVIESARFVA